MNLTYLLKQYLAHVPATDQEIEILTDFVDCLNAAQYLLNARLQDMEVTAKEMTSVHPKRGLWLRKLHLQRIVAEQPLTSDAFANIKDELKQIDADIVELFKRFRSGEL